MKRIFSLFTAICISLAISGCSKTPTGNFVTATTLPVYEIASALCDGTDITVQRLVSENVSCLHDYTLQVSQMQMIESASAIIVTGAGFENFLDDVISAEKTVIDASQNIHYLSIDTHNAHEHEHATDPHIWLAPENAMVMTDNILNGLIALFPQHANIMQKNYEVWSNQLHELAAFAQAELVDLQSKQIITFHDGFVYLANGYGLEIIHSMEEESGSEASAAELIEIIKLVQDNNISAIFTEKNGSDAAAKIISAETGAKIHQLDMAISGDSYIDAMYENIRTLKEALE